MFIKSCPQRDYQIELSLSNATILPSRGLSFIRQQQPDPSFQELHQLFQGGTRDNIPFLWKESHQEEITNEINPDLKHRTYITVEEWTYNFGPSRFLRTVILRNGVVAGFRTGPYGRTKGSDAPGPACDDRIMSVGDTKAEIVLRCGVPFYKSSYQEEQKERIDDSSNRKVIVTVEEWTYNFGPQRFMRIITFRNGTVTNIRTAGYGR